MSDANAFEGNGRAESILVVEDDDFFRELLLRQLAQQGYSNITEARDGYQALAMLRAGHVDLALLDIELPGLNGIEVLGELRPGNGFGSVPVIVISGVDAIDSVVKCIELGAEDYLSKPFNPVILRARIGASLEKRRLRRLDELRLLQIREEREKAEALLNVILPAAAAKELKDTGAVAPHRHDCVAVLFCDIAGFTAYCEQHEAEDVLARLQELVERFEQITDRHNMEKIKTIGDSFMVTAGMLRPTADPVGTAVGCGLDMIAATSEMGAGWQVRVGMDFGPLVSGVLGRQKYQFDVWGRVVNLASRMTEFASPGSIAMRRHTWQRLGGGFQGRMLGTREVKGIGPIELVECVGRSRGRGCALSQPA